MPRALKFTDIPNLEQDLVRAVTVALEEDIGSGDITAELIPSDHTSTAVILTREDCVVCGIAWVDEVFNQLDPTIEIEWHVTDGEYVKANTNLCTITGNSRKLLTGERTALNFMQLLSATATCSYQFAEIVKNSPIKILDTRKTIPGLRTAQKYAVKCGGCDNHRIGLYDAFLIKENHIAACGGIAEAIKSARKLYPDKTVEIEVETISQLKEAISEQADIVMLDNFSETELVEASELKSEEILFEVSGNIEKSKMLSLVKFPIDYISIGILTKAVRPVDLSMLVTNPENKLSSI